MNLGGGEFWDDWNESVAGAMLVVEKSVEDFGFVGEIACGVLVQSGECGCSADGFDKGFGRDIQHGFGGAGGDAFVGVVEKDGENFRAIRERKMRAGGDDGEFTFARGATVFEIFNDFRA